MKSTFTVGRGLKALLLAGGASTIMLSVPAYAQDTDDSVDCTVTPDDPSCTTGEKIVVTGSRIQRKDFESNSPMVTVDENFLKDSSTSAVEQQLNKLPQFVVSQSSTVKNNDPTGLLPAGGDIQPNATNTPGASTVSLRGVGSNRTLVLIDGRRGVPGNAGGSVDVSTIPTAALQRVEIISGGASATYGADAVAGVTNFILRKDFVGLELDGNVGFDQRGNGLEWQIGGIMGADFDGGRGNVSIAMQMNTRDRMLQRDNPWYKELWDNPDTSAGAFFFQPRPGVSGLALPASGTTLTDEFPGANPPVPNNWGSVYLNPDGSLVTISGLFGSNYGARGGGTDFLEPWPAYDNQIGAYYKTGSNGALYPINALTPQTIPTTRYNFLGQGNYEINDWIGVFAQGSFSHNSTYTVQEPGPITFGWDVLLPWGDQPYTGAIPGFQVNLSSFYGNGGVFNNAPYQNPAVPSSVIRNGDLYQPPFSFTNPYVDPTPGDLTDNPTNPAFQAMYPDLNCAGYTSHIGGCTNTEAFQSVIPQSIQNLLNARTRAAVAGDPGFVVPTQQDPFPTEPQVVDPNQPFSLAGYLPAPRETYSFVTTYNLIAGFQGYIPGTDWTWEIFVNHGVSETLSRQTGMYSLERLRAVFTAPNMGQGFAAHGNAFGGIGGLSNGFGAGYATCTTGLDLFGGYQGISNDCLEAIASDVSNRGTARQTIVEANFQGKLFDLPAGELRGAIGASYREERYEFINETLSSAGRSFLDQVVGIYPSQNMENNGYNVKEIYGELLIPLFHDLPGVQQFNLEVGGRLSDYTTTGTSYTFKVLGDWQVNDWLRFRGGFNRAERAPNIAELLLTPQQTFSTDPTGDVCSTNHQSSLSANPNGNADYLDVIAMCLALMQRDNSGVYVPYGTIDSYYDPAEATTRQPTGGGAGFQYSVGNQYFRENINSGIPALTPEIADTWTAGLVIQSPMATGPLSRLNITVDYFNIKVKNPIGNVGAGGVLLRCVSPQYNALASGVASGASDPSGLDTPAIRAAATAALAGGTCGNVFRNASSNQAGVYGTLNTGKIYSTYDNDGLIKLSGLDATISWSTDLGPGTLFASLNGNYMFHFEVQGYAGAPLVDYVGTLGTGLKGVNFASSIRYRIFGTLGYTWMGLNASLQWQHTPHINPSSFATIGSSNFTGIPAYDLFNFNASYSVTDNLRVRVGVDNLFNRKPAITGVFTGTLAPGQLPGGSYSLLQDIQGRRFSLGANIKF